MEFLLREDFIKTKTEEDIWKMIDEYEVTFRVRFNPENHKESDLSDPESFSHWLCDVIPDEIMRTFSLFKPEDTCDFVVVEMMSNNNRFGE